MPQIVFIFITLLAFGLLSVLAGLRLRSKKASVIHLLIFASLGFLSGLFQLMTVLEMTAPPGVSYALLSEFILLAMVLAFGALTLNFLNKGKNFLIGYWSGAAILLVGWGLVAFNMWGLDSLGLHTPLVIDGVGWIVSLATAFVSLGTEFKKQLSVKHLNRLRYWLIATSLMTVSGLILFISPNIFYWAGVTLIIIASWLAGYTVLSYHTPDLNLLVGRSLLSRC